VASLELAQLLRGESLRLAGGQGGGIRYGAHHAHAYDFFTVRHHIMIFVNYSCFYNIFALQEQVYELLYACRCVDAMILIVVSYLGFSKNVCICYLM